MMAATQEPNAQQDDAVVEREIAARRVCAGRRPKIEYTCSACGLKSIAVKILRRMRGADCCAGKK